MNKVIVLCLLQAITLSLCSMNAPGPEENSLCYFDNLADELLLPIFDYTANQETAHNRFLQLFQLFLVDKRWAALAKDQRFLKSILHSDAEFIALGEMLADDVSEGKKIIWTCPTYLPEQAKEAIKMGLLKKPVVWNFFQKTLRKDDRFSDTGSGNNPRVTSVAISNNNSSVVTGSEDGTARIWDVHSKCIATFKCHADDINSVAISNDNSFIVTGSSDKTAKIWDISSGKCIATLAGHQGWVNSVAISSNNRFIVTGSVDDTAKIWDAASGNCIVTLEGHRFVISSVAISSDNSFIITGSWDDTAKIWDVSSGNCIVTLEGHSAWINSVAISSDNRLIITGSWDKTAKIWDVESGKCITTLKGHIDDITSVAISSDNCFIITSPGDKTAIIYPLLHNQELETILEKIKGIRHE